MENLYSLLSLKFTQPSVEEMGKWIAVCYVFIWLIMHALVGMQSYTDFTIVDIQRYLLNFKLCYFIAPKEIWPKFDSNKSDDVTDLNGSVRLRFFACSGIIKIIKIK